MTNIEITLTNDKKMRFALDEKNAPLSTENFLALIDQNFFDGLCFHRVIDGFMIQGGGFKWDNGLKAKQSPFKAIKGEFSSNGVNNPLVHKEGAISMARTMVKDSATSQFFICVNDTPYLDGEYACFGYALDDESIKVAKEIGKVKTTSWSYYDDVPVEPIIIKSIKRI